MRQSYINAYKLMVGETTYNKLSEQHEFYLPVDHEDPKVLLNYFEGEEEYEKCQTIKLKLCADYV